MIEHGTLEHYSWLLWSHGKQNEGSQLVIRKYTTTLLLPEEVGVAMALLVHCDDLCVTCQLFLSYWKQIGSVLLLLSLKY